MKRLLSLFVILTLSLTACGASDIKNPNNLNSQKMQTDIPATGDKIALMETNFGEISIKLFPVQAPETVRNFEELAKSGFYNSLIFHRVIDGFMIQGGDPRGDGTGGETYKGPGTFLPDEISPDLTHIRGAVSMANRGLGTGTSQFFIVQAENGTPWLNGKHTVFGQVFSGMDVVDKIAKVKTGVKDKPTIKVEIKKVEVKVL